MAKNKISEWSSTPSNNTDIGGIDIAEGCAPSGINNGIRELMAQVKDMITGADGDNLIVGGNLTVTGTTTLGADLAIVDGGTGASTAADARTNLGLGTIATQSASNVAITGGTITGLSSALPVASGGTGSTISTGSGAVVLASSPTLTTPALGTPSSVDLTNATGTANLLNAGLGVNQTWQAVSRALNTLYTNTTGKPIQVCAGVMQPSGSGFVFQVNGTTVSFDSSVANVRTLFNIIVPAGATYQIVVTSGSPSLTLWTELR
jgi:hypothetical protein